MRDASVSDIREQLVSRRRKLDDVIVASPENQHALRLIAEVDEALERWNAGSYGLCKACDDPIEPERLMADPLLQFCLDHLSPAQQRALEDDLELATQIQGALLPQRTLSIADWEIAYHYEGAGPTSGDYCDLITVQESGLYFIVGDVMGKGVAASMLMAHLHASFRALVGMGLPLDEIMERASRTFCESTLPAYFATLVLGKAAGEGKVELSGAGHVPPLLVRGSEIEQVEVSGFPLGMFCDGNFSVKTVQISPGESVVLYTDGVTEAENRHHEEYGTIRFSKLLSEKHSLSPERLISACVQDHESFRSGMPNRDDLTIMAIRRS